MISSCRKVMSVMLAVCLALAAFPPVAKAQQTVVSQQEREYLSQYFQVMMENQRLKLYVNQALGEIAVEDCVSGQIWFSNPYDLENDAIASGMPKQQLCSALYVKYMDEQSNVFFAASRFSAVDREGLQVKVDQQGIICMIDFVREEFRIPVRYSLGEDYLKAEIMLDGIEEYGLNRISQITLLPFFGAGGLDEDGFLLVPDGSGALINFNNGRQAAETFQVNVYGNEPIFGQELMDTSRQSCYMPVFGIQKTGGAMLAVIHNGAEKASVSANVSRKYTSYNAVTSSYCYRMLGSVKLPTKNFQNRSVQILENEPGYDGNYEVRYYFLPRQVGYAQMAQRYRQYLEQEAGLSGSDGEIKLTLDVYGAVTLTKPTAGIPAPTVIPLTSFSSAEELLNRFSESGVDGLTVRFNGWAAGGMYAKLPVKGGAEGKLGGKDGLQALMETANQVNTQIYWNGNLTNVYRTGNGFNRFFHAAQNINRTVSLQNTYKQNLFIADADIDPFVLAAPRLLLDYHKQYAAMLSSAAGGAKNLGIGLETTGSLCYSDFSGNPSSRTQTTAANVAAMKSLEDDGYALLLSDANAYAFPYADMLVNTPDGSSGFDIENEAIPFYQITLCGLVNMACKPINLCSQPRVRLLQCVEMGMSPCFAMAAGDTSQIKNSRMDALYSIDAENWAQPAVLAYQEVSSALAGTAGKKITNHVTLEKGVTKTAYENGITVYVNYTSAAVTVDGITVKPLDWHAEKGQAQ